MSTEPETHETNRWTPWAIVAAALLIGLFGVIAATSLRGCLFADPQQAAKREEERKKQEDAEKKKKQEIEVSLPAIEPADPKSPSQYVKPGHWATSTQQMRANYRDFVGDLRDVVVDKQGDPTPVPRTPFVLRGSRPVALAKGRPKSIESALFVPQTTEEIRLATELAEHGLGLTIGQQSTKLVPMPSYQYHFVVLAKEPARYAYLNSLDSVQVPFSGESAYDGRDDALHYRVVPLNVSNTIPLSDNSLAWTSIAYILWDEVNPEPFTPEQEQALVDWLHWGGQLIISGPDSLDSLRGSFLEKYLPVTGGGSRTIAAADLEELNRGWMISTRGVRGEPLVPKVPWSGIKLTTQPDAQPLPNTGDFFVERQVGRGRIVVSAMQLAERDLINWRSGFESFFNACLLRRPPRVYLEGSAGGPSLIWDSTVDESLSKRRLDARITTSERFFARDEGVDNAYHYENVSDEFGQNNQFNQLTGQQEPIKAYRPPANTGGIGAWNDFSATANAARQALREAAGVEVPGAGFVVVCLTAYLLALVPLNWLVFHTLGRVEWAWIAAPIIAIFSTFMVVHQAQLDIGFVRAQTEIGLLELQPDYARSHLSRFTALYTSLSTTYDLTFDNMTTLAAPFPTQADYQRMRGQGLTNVDFQRYDNVRLAGLPVSSNSTGMVHSEQMFPLDGSIRLGRSTARGGRQIENRSQFKLQSVAVVRRWTSEEERKAGRSGWEGKWIGDLAPGQSMPIAFLPIGGTGDAVPFSEERTAEERLNHQRRLNLEPLFKLALELFRLEPGETRLVARIDDVLPGETIEPAASQTRSATMVVAHLAYGPLPPPQKDRNTRRDIKIDNKNNNDDNPLEAINSRFSSPLTSDL